MKLSEIRTSRIRAWARLRAALTAGLSLPHCHQAQRLNPTQTMAIMQEGFQAIELHQDGEKEHQAVFCKGWKNTREIPVWTTRISMLTGILCLCAARLQRSRKEKEKRCSPKCHQQPQVISRMVQHCAAVLYQIQDKWQSSKVNEIQL